MITAFIVEKMTAYISGGMTPETAARFTRGELEAIYQGKHHSRDSAGNMRLTPLPEAMDIDAAMVICDETLIDILEICTQSAEKGPTMDTETKTIETQGSAPENPTQQELSGFEKMIEYARKTA
jgi:hypothetical protein